MNCKKAYLLTGLAFLAIFLFPCCYSFKGTSIPPGKSTFSVSQVKSTVLAAPPTIGQDFREKLMDKIRSESRLNYSDSNPDLTFDCKVTKYKVTSIDPQPDETTAFNQLEIAVEVSYIDNHNEDNNWTQTFSFFERFESSQNLASVQDQLHEVIFTDITTKVFNRAFTEW